MKSTPFNPATDLSPIPFEEELYQLAWQLKQAGLSWKPHVGCFVWDHQDLIEPRSPFPGNVYFILNLNHFLKRFETTKKMAEALVWLPTWEQCLQLLERHGDAARDSISMDTGDLKQVYQRLLALL